MTDLGSLTRREALMLGRRAAETTLVLSPMGLLLACQPGGPDGQLSVSSASSGEIIPASGEPSLQDISAQLQQVDWGAVHYHGESNQHGVQVVNDPNGFPITSDFESRFNPDGSDRFSGGHPRHRGIDFDAPTGTPVIAAGPGYVDQSQYGHGGNKVRIQHIMNGRNYALSTVYSHMHSRAVEEGQRVERGTLLGTVGNTGDILEYAGRRLPPHLHFGLWRNDGNVQTAGDWKSANPHEYWLNGPGRVTLFKGQRQEYWDEFKLTAPLPGREDIQRYLQTRVADLARQ